jgi:plastocyanin
MKKGMTAAALSLAVAAAWCPPVGAASHARAASAGVSVKAFEFKYTFSKKTVGKGSVAFTIKNTGHVNHDLKINGKQSNMVKPGKSTTFTVKFTKAGKFKFLCTVSGHAAAGMKGTLTVT